MSTQPGTQTQVWKGRDADAGRDGTQTQVWMGCRRKCGWDADAGVDGTQTQVGRGRADAQSTRYVACARVSQGVASAWFARINE
eukprot:366034-Chlamydomonas_euryale.AAC.3